MAKKRKSKSMKPVKKAARALKASTKKKVKAASKTAKVKKIQAIPKGYEKAVPYIIVNDGVAALDFYKKAFGAVELYRFEAPGGKIGHAEFKIGSSNFMIADEHPAMGAVSPSSLGGSPVGFYIYVKDVDSFFMKALSEGAKELQPLEDKFYGDRTGSLVDPYGHKWTFGTHKADVSKEEMKRKMDEMYAASATPPEDSSNL
jgi:PhnB protein